MKILKIMLAMFSLLLYSGNVFGFSDADGLDTNSDDSTATQVIAAACDIDGDANAITFTAITPEDQRNDAGERVADAVDAEDVTVSFNLATNAGEDASVSTESTTLQGGSQDDELETAISNTYSDEAAAESEGYAGIDFDVVLQRKAIDDLWLHEAGSYAGTYTVSCATD